MSIKNLSLEYLGKDELRNYQEQRLKEHLHYLKANSPYYQRLFQEHHIDVDQINSLADLSLIPVTEKSDLQVYNQDFLCVDPALVRDYVTTSGTLGDPVLVALTDSDLDRLSVNESFSYACMGLPAGDVVQLTTTMDRRFMAGLAYFLGARKAGLGVVRVGSGVPELQWDTISRVHPKALVCVPSFLLKMIEYAERSGIDFRSCSVKKVLCIGEAIRNPDFTPNTLAKRILDKWDVELYSTYASTEMATAFTECQHATGGHYHPELLIAEFLDDDNEPVADGQPGELVVTTLGVEGMPLLRFKTGDILQPLYGLCACGRTTMRVGPVIGRKNQMIKYKGTTIYPPAMFDLLHDFSEVENYLVEITSNTLGEDEIAVLVGTVSPQEDLMNRIKDRFRAKLRVSPRIIFMDIEALNRLKLPDNSRKSLTLIDRRVQKKST